MSRRFDSKRGLCVGVVVLLSLALGTLPVLAQFKELDSEAQGPQWSMAVPRLRYLQNDVELEQDNYKSPGASSELKGTRWYVSPRLGLEWQNYLYHPDLLTYSLLFEPGYVWQDRKLGGRDTFQNELSLNGTYTANLLQAKPYASTASYSRSREELKYDFFNTATVDSETWGATSGYRDGPVPVAVAYHQTHEDSTDFNQDTITDQKTFDLSARNERVRDNLTDFTYQYNQFQRQTQIPGSSFSSEDDYHHLALLDTEHFERSALRSSFRFDDRQSEGVDSTDLNAALNYNLELRPDLQSYYDYSFSQFTGEGYDSLQNYADAGLRHQLFESLSSALELHGSTLNSDSGPSTLDSVSGGASVSAEYNKRVGSWGRLNIGNSSSYNWTDQEQTGTEEIIANESHTVPANGLVRLSIPRDLSIASVTDARFAPLQPGLDYTVVQTTDPWQIQILPFGPAHIQPGAIILVTYTVQANPSGDYTVFGNESRIRFSFFHDMAAVFARFSLTENHASSPEFLLQDDQTYQAGAEFTWHGLKLYGDYTDDHSTLYTSHAINLAETYSMSLSSDSTLGIDLNQQWSDNAYHTGMGTNLNENMTFYNYMLHFEWHPTPAVNWNVEVGYRQQRGLGIDDDLFAARTYLRWKIGKLQLHLGYEHEMQELASSKRDRDFGYLRVRRDF